MFFATHGCPGPRLGIPLVPYAQHAPRSTFGRPFLRVLRVFLLAYRLKKPGNFAQHYLETCHGNRPRSVVDLHQYHMERAPHQKKSKKKSGSQNRPSPLGKVTFFRRKNADFSARVARFFRKFWRSSGAKGRDLSLGFKASEKSEGTLPVQCDHSEAIARGSTMRFGCQGR